MNLESLFDTRSKEVFCQNCLAKSFAWGPHWGTIAHIYRLGGPLCFGSHVYPSP
jgi:hypothetical protein